MTENSAGDSVRMRPAMKERMRALWRRLRPGLASGLTVYATASDARAALIASYSRAPTATRTSGLTLPIAWSTAGRSAALMMARVRSARGPCMSS